jgi:hypothetical protein
MFLMRSAIPAVPQVVARPDAIHAGSGYNLAWWRMVEVRPACANPEKVWKGNRVDRHFAFSTTSAA